MSNGDVAKKKKKDDAKRSRRKIRPKIVRQIRFAVREASPTDLQKLGLTYA